MELRCLVLASLLLGDVFAQAQSPTCPQVRPYTTTLRVVSSPVVVVADVTPGSIAERAGLRKGDVILSTNGHGVRDRVSFGDFLGLIREHALWTAARLEVLRPLERGRAQVIIRLGTPLDRVGFASTHGFYIERTIPGGLGEKIGLQEGDFLSKINGKPVGQLNGPIDFDVAVQESLANGKLTLGVSRLKGLSGDAVTWTETEITLDGTGPAEGPVPPPGIHVPEIKKF